MRRLATFVAVAFIVLFASAQEKMKITLTDGSTVEYNVAEVVKVYFDAFAKYPTPKIVDLGLSVKWASWNVGASSESEVGAYFAWGETEEKDYYSTSNYSFWKDSNMESIGSDISGTQYDVAFMSWGSSWRMPTYADWYELYTTCIVTSTSVDGINGCRFTGPNGNSIFIPVSGYMNGYKLGEETTGMYWASTQGKTSKSAYEFDFDSKANCSLNAYVATDKDFGRIWGMPIRAVYADKQSIKVEVTTNDAQNISQNSAILNGMVSGQSPSASVGFVYGTNSDISILNGINVIATPSVYFSSVINNLSSATKYYYRAYVLDNGSYFYGDVKSFETKAPEYTLSVTPTSLSFDYGSGSKSISITSNTDWTVKSSASWLIVSKTSGTGNASVNLSASANTNTSSRSATVTITGGGKTVTCSVSQAAAPEPSIVMMIGSYQISADAKTIDVYVSSNTSWTVSSNQTWAKPTQTSGSGDMTLPVAVSANYNSTSRTATLTFTAGTKTAKCQIIQDGKKITLLFEEPFIAWGTQRTNVMSTMKTRGYTLYSNDALANGAPLSYEGKYEEIMSIYTFNSAMKLDDIIFYLDASKISVSEMGKYLQDMSYEYQGETGGFNIYISESANSIVGIYSRKLDSDFSITVVEYMDPSIFLSAKSRNAIKKDIDTSAFGKNQVDEQLVRDLISKKLQDKK